MRRKVTLRFILSIAGSLMAQPGAGAIAVFPGSG